MGTEGVEREQITVLLNRLGSGDRGVENELLGCVLAELQKLARTHMAGVPEGQLLQPTALVHEAWIKLVDHSRLEFQGRHCFYGLASRVMRTVLVDHLRASGAQKRGGQFKRVTLSLQSDGRESATDGGIHPLDLEEALGELDRRDPHLVRLVELRCFGGLNNLEIAAELQWSLRKVERQWRFARAWLRTRLGEEDS